MPTLDDLSKAEAKELRDAIIDAIKSSATALKKGRPEDNDFLVLQEIQSDCIRLQELMQGRISPETVDLYKVKMK